MVTDVEETAAVAMPSSSTRPSSIEDAWAAHVANPDLRGHAVLDTGATETVTSLAALEAIHRRRTELLGHTDHVEVVPGPGKVLGLVMVKHNNQKVSFI